MWAFRMNNKARCELKYQLTVFEYLRLKNRIRCFVDTDQYSLVAPQNRYYVRSLYFDTYNYWAYFDKLTGSPERIKLRIRTYFSTPKAPFVNVELKVRRYGEIEKYVARVSVADCEQFLKTKKWKNDSEPVLNEFQRLVMLKSLAPKLLVDYEREAYVAKGDRNVRITFDHNMRFAYADELYPAAALFRKKDSFLVVFEIKCQQDTPLWLEQIVKEFNLKIVPNSKYAHGIEQTQHAIFV